MSTSETIRIWHQGFVDFDKVPVYRRSFEDHVARMLDPGVEVTLHGLRPGTFGDHVTPIEALHNPYAEMVLSHQICEAALTAERAGYDAVIVNCFYDPGLSEARSLVDIPVLSLFESSFTASVPFGRTVGLLALNEDQCHKHRELAASYGWADRLAATTPVEPGIDEYMLEASLEDAAEVVAGIAAACERLRAAGAEIVIPGDGVLNDFIWRHGIGAGPGLPMLDAAGAQVRYGIHIATQRRFLGITTSRVRHYAASDHVPFIRNFDDRSELAESAFSGVGTVRSATPR